MINICIHCGHHFTTPVNRYNRPYSESDDSLPYCPNCGSEDFEPAGHCIKCDDYFPLDSMIGSICRDCVEKHMTRNNAFKYTWDRDLSAAELFVDTDDEVKQFLSEDIYDFSEWLEGQDD